MKSWIEQNLILSDKFISKRCRKDWFENNQKLNEYYKIIDTTKFLPNTASLPQRCWHIMYDKMQNIPCGNPTCNNNKQFFSFSRGYTHDCSVACGQLNPNTLYNKKIISLKKYGVEHPSKLKCVTSKRRHTNLKKYGVENVSQLSNIKKKKEDTLLLNYGVKSPMQSKELRDVSRRIVFNKYGVDNIRKNYLIQQKCSATRFKNYYNTFLLSKSTSKVIIPLFSLDDFDGVTYYDKKYKFKCSKCNTIFEDTLYKDLPRCLTCYPIVAGTSKAQFEIFNFINEIVTDKVLFNDTSLLNNGRELDIYIPEKKIAIEFDGLYWHSENKSKKNKNYHLKKTIECKNKGVQLLHIFENEWFDKQDIVKSIIKSKLGCIENKIYARNCEMKEITFKEALTFYNSNHIQSGCQFKKSYGLYYNNELVCAVSFGKNRFKNDNSIELIRFCNKINHSVIGGFSKLIKYFIKNNNVEKITTFADKRYSNGDIYINNGFDLVENTALNYYYVKNGKLLNRINFQKHKLSKKLKTFNYKLTEWQNMLLNGYDRIWDCGNYKFILNLKGE